MNNIPYNKTIESPSESLWATLLWLVTILFLPQLVVSFFFELYFEVFKADNFINEGFELWFKSPLVFFTLISFTYLLTFPLLMKATYSKRGINYLRTWAVKSVNKKELSKWLLLGVFFWFTTFTIESWLDIPKEPFISNIQTVMNDYTMVFFIFMSICFIVPIAEECIFRGWLFNKIALSRYGKAGALTVTSVIFTIIHTQYDYFSSVVIVFLLGFILGLVRYKSNNTSYCIVIHILLNILTTISLL